MAKIVVTTGTGAPLDVDDELAATRERDYKPPKAPTYQEEMRPKDWLLQPARKLIPELVRWTYCETGSKNAHSAKAWVQIQTAAGQLIEGSIESPQAKSKSELVATAICKAYRYTGELKVQQGVPLGDHQAGVYVFIDGNYGCAPGSIEDMSVAGKATLAALGKFIEQATSL